MFEDDGCAAFGRLRQGFAPLGPIGEVDGEKAEALAARWALRYGHPASTHAASASSPAFMDAGSSPV